MKSAPLAAIAILAAATVLLLAPMPTESRLARALLDLGHAPLFAVAAVIVYRAGVYLLPTRERAVAWGVGVGLVGFGLLIEVVQGYVGRGTSFQDGLADLVGVLAGLYWVRTRDAAAERKRRIRWAVVGLLLIGEVYPLMVLADVVWQKWQLPVIAAFESPTELLRWQAKHARMTRVREPATQGRWSLRVELEPHADTSVYLLDPPADWRGRRDFVFDVEVDAGPPLPLTVKVEDRRHNHDPSDRFERQFHLTPGRHTIRIPLAEIAAAPRTRALDLGEIGFVQFFAWDLPAPRTIYLDHLRLE